MRPVLLFALPCPKCGAESLEPCTNLDGSPRSPKSGPHVSRTPKHPCGSYGGYSRHMRAGETPCEPCREANRRYMAEYRDRRPEVRARDVAGLRARNAAEKRLVQLHRAEFDALVAEELAAAAEDGAA